MVLTHKRPAKPSITSLASPARPHVPLVHFTFVDCAFTCDRAETLRSVIGGDDAELGEERDGDADPSMELRAGVIFVERAFDDAGGAFDEGEHDVVAGLFGLGLPGLQAFLEIGILPPAVDGAAPDARLPARGDDVFAAGDGAEDSDLLIAQICHRKIGRFQPRLLLREERILSLFSGLACGPLRAGIQRRIRWTRGRSLKSV